MPDNCKFYLMAAPVSKVSKYFDADDWLVAGRYAFSLTARPDTQYYNKYLAGEKRREHATKLFSSYAVGDPVKWRGTENLNMQKIGCMIGTA